MKTKPNHRVEAEIRRLILEKFWMGRNWGHNHVEERNVPKGLPEIVNPQWYHYVKHELKRRGLLVMFKEHGKDLYGLNPRRKKEIERFIGVTVGPQSIWVGS